ncbi:hypothetical protein PVAP13_9NG492414 [Panicum virgatum]|uniref:Uncharacterized protein n=1 Tax=Panicum virgatum TaxID=38727 RepID=A0A8T0MU80_PANVG|nr:hypothetical protein PVAP13_9NG492414 [Panicum virgatum]
MPHRPDAPPSPLTRAYVCSPACPCAPSGRAPRLLPRECAHARTRARSARFPPAHTRTMSRPTSVTPSHDAAAPELLQAAGPARLRPRACALAPPLPRSARRRPRARGHAQRPPSPPAIPHRRPATSDSALGALHVHAPLLALRAAARAILSPRPRCPRRRVATPGAIKAPRTARRPLSPATATTPP